LRAEGFQSVPGHGALADVDGHRVAVGNRRLMEREPSSLAPSLLDARNWPREAALPSSWLSTVGLQA